MMMKAPTFLLLAAVAAALPVQEWLKFQRTSTFTKTPSRLGDVYKFCNTTVESLIINNVTVKPDPPVKGQALTVFVAYDLTEELTGGSVDVYIKFGIIPVINKQYSLCDIVEMVDMKCPLKPFQGSNSTTQDLPSLGGHVTGQVTAKDQDGKEIACVKLDVEL